MAGRGKLQGNRKDQQVDNAFILCLVYLIKGEEEQIKRSCLLWISSCISIIWRLWVGCRTTTFYFQWLEPILRTLSPLRQTALVGACCWNLEVCCFTSWVNIISTACYRTKGHQSWVIDSCLSEGWLWSLVSEPSKRAKNLEASHVRRSRERMLMPTPRPVSVVNLYIFSVFTSCSTQGVMDSEETCWVEIGVVKALRIYRLVWTQLSEADNHQ